MKKPPECVGCPLYNNSEGFAPPSGPTDALICMVGEALGREEVEQSRPFVGPAGRKLDSMLQRLGMNREQVRVGNVISCRPPGNMLVGASYEHGAIAHCRVHRSQLEGHRVYVTLGVTATRTFTKEILDFDYSGKLENWHGYVVGDGAPNVVPTFHPSHLIQGQQKLTGVVLHDIKRAMELASFGFAREPVSLVCDPSPEWFAQWIDTITEDCWLSVDIETPIKTGNDEADLIIPIGTIVRINFSHNPGEGITVPFEGRYLPAIEQALQSPCTKVFWNERFDVPILEKAGMVVNGQHLDGMWAWHFLQSDLPKGLGFVAPFYSDLPPWKHLSDANPALYGAMDGVQQLRLMFGIARDLKSSGQWESFLTNVCEMDRLVLHPASEVGVLLDSSRLLSFQSSLKQHGSSVFEKIQQLVPEEVRPLVPRDGWKRFPTAYPPDSIFSREVEVDAFLCTTCGEEGVSEHHRCSATADQ